MTTEVVSNDLTAALRRLKLSGLLNTLPDRLTLARAQKMPYQDFLLVLLSDEVTRRNGLVADNVSIHHGKIARAWLEAHPRFCMHFTPVHCSWMNQVEQWFSILQRKRLVAPNFVDLADLEHKVIEFIAAWNSEAHPFKWTSASFDRVLAQRTRNLALAFGSRPQGRYRCPGPNCANVT